MVHKEPGRTVPNRCPQTSPDGVNAIQTMAANGSSTIAAIASAANCQKRSITVRAGVRSKAVLQIGNASQKL